MAFIGYTPPPPLMGMKVKFAHAQDNLMRAGVFLNNQDGRKVSAITGSSGFHNISKGLKE